MKETKHIKTLNSANLKESAVKGGCGECQASCQSACKTTCTVANQKCESANRSLMPILICKTILTRADLVRSLFMQFKYKKEA